jgi:GLPGLI family protein
MQKILIAAFLSSALLPVAADGVRAQAPAMSQAAATPPAGPIKEGKIIYERKVNMHRRLTDESMKAMIPEFNSSKMELDFSADESIYKNIKEDEDIRDKAGQDNGGVMIRFAGGFGNDQTYKNYSTDMITQQRELGPKKYLIEDTLKRQNWKLEEETKTIKGYVCKKATTRNRDGKDVIAWYAEDIQSSTGPDLFGGLPGMILELNINDAEIVFSTLDVVSKGFDKAVVKAPTEGKKIARKEYDKMMEEQFGVKPGGGTTIRIIRN